MKIAIGQINPTIGDFRGNEQLILENTRRAKNAGADMIVFPEMSLCGYPPMDLLDQPAFMRENISTLRRIQHAVPADIAVVVGYVSDNKQMAGKPLVNAASIILNGEIVCTQGKTLLPTYDVFDEERYFEPASAQHLFEWKGYKVGIAICEDLWWESEPVPGERYPVDPVNNLLDMGMTLLVAPSASPFQYGKAVIREDLLQRISGSSGVPAVYANMVGGNDNLVFDGNSFAVSAAGECIARAASFEEDMPVFQLDGPAVGCELENDKFEDIRRALVLGIKDYLGKCGFQRVHLGLSGGIDSALVAALAVEALGPDRVTCFGMPSRYSSEGSLTDARQLSSNLGCRFEVIPIESMFTAFNEALAPVFGGREPDITEENIQARIRGVLLMAYSNKFDSLVLTTGNKSELATGYCTLYGDMCGSLAVIGDLLKTEVYDLCRHINREKETIPDSIITKPPSAELRPDQTDQDSLPPYEVLDEILTQYVLENKSKAEIVRTGQDPELVGRVLTMVARAEYKRRQAPPVLKVSPRAFGTGRRVPIARKIYES